MPKQLELVPSPPLKLNLAGSAGEPRLWVRRLKIWSEPGEVIRDIQLRPGLNIVWSPDPASEDGGEVGEGSLGHGSGKTLLCRLIRYCLGEDRFASAEQREAISHAFNEGFVGAEVIMDGEPWSIVRPLGIRRRHVAMANGDLDAIASGEGESTGMTPFLEEVAGRFLGKEVLKLFSGRDDREAWLTALAWLSRDQECRLSHVLSWREAITGSDSPVRNMDSAQRLDALRALLGAIDAREQRLRLAAGRLDAQQKEAERTAGHCGWAIKRRQQELTVALKVKAGSLAGDVIDVDILRNMARRNLEKVISHKEEQNSADLPRLRSQRDKARTNVEKLRGELHGVEASIPLAQRLLSSIRSELSNLIIEKGAAEHPPCPICAVPIDQVLAEGCKLSREIPDLETVKKRWASKQKDREREQENLEQLKETRDRIERELRQAEPVLQKLQARIAALEKAQDAKSEVLLEARRLLREVDRLQGLYSDRDEAIAQTDKLGKRVEREKGKVAALRKEQEESLERLTQLFNAIIRDLAGEDASGRLVLSGRGLELKVEMGGERSTVAIDSLKILAFDLAALCMTMEGATHLPAFLLHDSPREADLGLTIYYRLFRLVRALEEVGGQPLFQYIVTTTTPPPEDLRKEPWLRLRLQGSPAEERLLKRDL